MREATPTLPRCGVNATGCPPAISISSSNRRAVERALARMAADLDRPQFVLTAAGRQALEVQREHGGLTGHFCRLGRIYGCLVHRSVPEQARGRLN